MARKLITIIVVLFMLTLTVSPINGQAAGLGNKVSEVKTEVSPQVIHSQQNYTSGSIRQFVNVLDVNLNNTYTKLEIGMPNPINSLKQHQRWPSKTHMMGIVWLGLSMPLTFRKWYACELVSRKQ